MKKLNGSGNVRKASVVEEPEDLDAHGELSTATDQVTINQVVDELNDLMIGGNHEINDEQSFMKIDE